MDFSDISEIHFGIYGTQSVRDAGSHRGQNFDHGYKRVTGIHKTINSNPVKYQGPDHVRATHYKLIKKTEDNTWGVNPDLIPWEPLTDEVRSHLNSLRDSGEWLRPSHWESAEKWKHRQKCFGGSTDEEIVGYQLIS